MMFGVRTKRPEIKRRRRVVIAALLVAVLLATPIPWLLPKESSFGMAWQLDGRLIVNGVVVDPAGRWSWLTAGRPPVLAEVLFLGQGGTRDLRSAPAAIRPSVTEPMAAAVGLAHAGMDIEFGLIVEATGSQGVGYPEMANLVELNGIPLISSAAWEEAASMMVTPVTFRTSDGTLYEAPGPTLPYDRVYVIGEPPPGLNAVVGGRLATAPPFSWFRDLGLGGSHGLIVALVVYAYTVDPTLADGLHIAATGGIRSDGTVTRIGGLPAKAAAARRSGVDVLFFPATQASELVDFKPGRMNLVPVFTLNEAVSYMAERLG